MKSTLHMKANEDFPRYCRGYVLINEKLGKIVNGKIVEKFYFVLDSEQGSLKLFKSPENHNPKKSYSIQGGSLKRTESNFFC